MSPSPHWGEPAEAPLFAALAAAQHDAWQVPEDRRHAVFVTRFRQLVGPARAEPLLASAITLFTAQALPPAGWEDPPRSAYWRICPRCTQLKATPHTIPQRGRLELRVLRDATWLASQLDRGRTHQDLARQLHCDGVLVRYWAEKHGLQSARAERHEEIEATVRALHAQKRGPGGIARELDTEVKNVRRALHRLGLATAKRGMVYHHADWWRDRLEAQGWTVRQCAREAGLKPHGATYYVTKFGLSHVTAARVSRKGMARWKPKYAVIADAVSLRRLLDEHGTYEGVARAVGCAPSLVSRYARKLLGMQARHSNVVPHAARAWWTDRLDRGLSTWQLADEAGLPEKSAREKLRLLGAELLAQGYRNNMQAERAKRATGAAERVA